MKKFNGNRRDKIIMYFMVGVMFVITLSAVSLLGGGIMKLFGFEYRNVLGVIIFFLTAAVVSYPLSLLAGTLPKALVIVNRMSLKMATVLFVILDTLATFAGLYMVDNLMESIEATAMAMFMISLILAL